MVDRARIPAAVAVTVGLWGSAFVAIRATLPAFGWSSLASGRLLLGAVAFLLLARGRGVGLPDRRQLPLLVALGATGFAGYQLSRSAGEETVTAGTGALLFAVAPVLVALLARPLLGERLDRRGWMGVGLAVCGVATVATAQGLAVAGAPLVLAGVCLYALWVVLQKRALRTMPPFTVTAWSAWFGAAIA